MKLLTSLLIIITVASSCQVTKVVVERTKKIGNTIAEQLVTKPVVKAEPAEIATNRTMAYNNMSVAKTSSTKSNQQPVVERGGKLAKHSSVTVNKGLFESGIDNYPEFMVLEYAKGLKKYAVAKNMDTSYAFVINMAIRSGKKRFFVVNLTTMTIENAGLVSHGNAGMRFSPERNYSNAYGSNCTSLGKYKIGRAYMGGFGLAYKLTGLDASNSNAFDRGVVLHSMGCISYRETDMPSCQSEGCPAVAVQFLIELQKILDQRDRPVVLGIFDSSQEQSLAKK